MKINPLSLSFIFDKEKNELGGFHSVHNFMSITVSKAWIDKNNEKVDEPEVINKYQT